MAALLRSPGAALLRSSWTPLQRVQTQNTCSHAAEGGRKQVTVETPSQAAYQCCRRGESSAVLIKSSASTSEKGPTRTRPDGACPGRDRAGRSHVPSAPRPQSCGRHGHVDLEQFAQLRPGPQKPTPTVPPTRQQKRVPGGPSPPGTESILGRCALKTTKIRKRKPNQNQQVTAALHAGVNICASG